MAKEATAAKTEDRTMPETPAISGIMSEEQKRIYQAVKTAAMPKMFDSVEELAPRLVMQVPSVFKTEYPEWDYGWADVNDLSATLDESEGQWAVVTRTNHSKIPDRYFDLATGGVLYKGQNILIFRYKKTTELLEKKNILAFKAVEKENLQGMAQRFNDGGIEIGRLEQVRDPGDGYNTTDLEPDAQYDFGAPSGEEA